MFRVYLRRWTNYIIKYDIILWTFFLKFSNIFYSRWNYCIILFLKKDLSFLWEYDYHLVLGGELLKCERVTSRENTLAAAMRKRKYKI